MASRLGRAKSVPLTVVVMTSLAVCKTDSVYYATAELKSTVHDPEPMAMESPVDA